MVETTNIKEYITTLFSPIAPTILSNAPADNTTFPIINYYFLTIATLITYDNTFTNHKNATVRLTIYSTSADELNELKREVVKKAKSEGEAVLRNENDVFDTGDGIVGYYYEFQFTYLELTEED